MLDLKRPPRKERATERNMAVGEREGRRKIKGKEGR